VNPKNHFSNLNRLYTKQNLVTNSVQLSFLIMSSSENFGNPLRKFKLVFLGEQSGKEKELLINAFV
jgi:hypothetical protein